LVINVIFFIIIFFSSIEKKKNSETIMQLKIFENYLISVSGDGSVFVWRLKDWVLLHKMLTNLKKGINDFSIHPSGKILVLVSKTKKIIFMDLTTTEMFF